MATEFKSFYNVAKGSEDGKCYYPTRLDVYGRGCFYNCNYCYAKRLLDFRKHWHPNDVGIADIEKVKRTIHKKIEPNCVVRLGGMTDCFQPIEKYVKNTYHTIEKLNEKSVHYLIVTKSPLVATDEYLDLFDRKLAHIQVSIPTDNNDVLSKTDNAPSFQERVDTIETLQENNFDVSVRLSPFLFETVNYDIINDIKVDKCLVEFLRITPLISKTMNDFITFEDYSIKSGGYRHLPLEIKLRELEKLTQKMIN